jgi:hypothetical protein
MHFTAASTVKNGHKDTIAQVGGQPITMIGAGEQVLVTPSALGSNGASFSVSEAPTPALPGAPGFGRPGHPFRGRPYRFGPSGANSFDQGGFGGFSDPGS